MPSGIGDAAWGIENLSSLYAEARQREPGIPVQPLGAPGEPGGRAKRYDLLGPVFVRALRPDPLVRLERQLEARGADRDTLVPGAHQMHLHPRGGRVPHGAMDEAIEV